VQHLQEDYGIRADVVSGPATDNRVGVRFVEQQVGVTAINARTHAKALGDHLLALLADRGVGRAANAAVAGVP